MKLVVLFGGLLAVGLAAGWPRGGTALVSPAPGRPDARMSVLYWPRAEGCLASQSGPIQALRDFGRDFPDTEVITMLAEDSSWPTAGDLAAPGVRRLLSKEDYSSRCCRPSRLPRVEVWSAAGELLMWRSLTEVEGSGRRLFDELKQARGLARPETGSS